MEGQSARTALSVQESHSDRAAQAELALQAIDALPTLNSVAVRVLELTSSDDSQASEVIRLIGSDPALAANVLKLCRCSERGRASDVTTVERAVLLLGFDAVRCAVLSLGVLDALGDAAAPTADAGRDELVRFDPRAFWHHSLAVALLAEEFGVKLTKRIAAGEAFLAGLLHDLGLLALHMAMPNELQIALQRMERYGITRDRACRDVIGIDPHAAGRRLAEHWNLPHQLADVMWLHGQRLQSLPDLPHRAIIGLITLADGLAARHYVYPGPAPAPDPKLTDDLAAALGLVPHQMDAAVEALPEQVQARAEALGLGLEAGSAALIRALARANEVLGRRAAELRQRAEWATRQSETLRAITRFHESAQPGGSVTAMLGKVVRSASDLFGGDVFAVAHQVRSSGRWHLLRFGPDGRLIDSRTLHKDGEDGPAQDHCAQGASPINPAQLLPVLREMLTEVRDLSALRLTPLRCGWGVTSILLHNSEIEGSDRAEQLEALSRTWASAVAATLQHEGAVRLSEQLAEVNRELAETQDELAEAHAMAAIGEIAAGAAHEMNNPLTVISGRSQLLENQLKDPHQRGIAGQIAEAAHRLSDMITALRTFAEPVLLNRRPTAISELLDAAVHKAIRRAGGCEHKSVSVQIEPQGPLALALVDPEQMSTALAELIRNALELEASRQVTVGVQMNPADGRLRVWVRDDGPGLSEHALVHAFDPFFSDKPAGRQSGLGLARCRRVIEAHGGQVTLENGADGGAVAMVTLGEWAVAQEGRQRDVA